MDILNIIQKYSLTVRCLPFIVRQSFSYVEGDEIEEGYTLTYWKPDLDYFKNNSSISGGTPKTRMEYFYKRFPNGRGFIHKDREVEKGGWWYVKETPNTDSIVRFDRKNDKFFAPTLEEAINLFLESKKQ